MKMVPECAKWEIILPVYQQFFYYARKVGLFPFIFDPDTLELSPIDSGFSFYLFLFNTFVLWVHLCKILFLLLVNLSANFENETLKGGYIFQLLYVAGIVFVFDMMYVFNQHREEVGLVVSSCLQLERQTMKGKCILKKITKTFSFFL